MITLVGPRVPTLLFGDKEDPAKAPIANPWQGRTIA
jgi:hypothetical protein